MLHLTNGDSVALSLRRAGMPGTVVAWRDVLHEGPVPAGLTLEGLSDLRARFLADWGAGPFPQISASFGARDSALRSARRVVLWFEHDLYDQLQLLQILATLAIQPGTSAQLIAIDSFPGVVPFHGLGQLTTAQLATLWPQRRTVTPAQRALASRAWKAFTAADPGAVRRLIESDLTALPFLRSALERLLEEHPAPPTGLPRTERQFLAAVAAGHQRSDDIFRASQAMERAPFLGDTTAQKRLAGLVNARNPLLTQEPHTLTAAGQRVLAGEVDARQLNGIDRWIGGVHLKI